MLAFHNDPKIKEKYLLRVQAHRLADEIIKGQYWNKDEDGIFRGCAVGCTLHSNDHGAYESELGIPRILARLEDGIFENLSVDRAKIWPEEFLSAIKVGSDLSDVWPQFAMWLLIDEKYGALQYVKTDKQKKAIQTISDYFKVYSKVTLRQWMAASDAASDANLFNDNASYAIYYVAAHAVIDASRATADAYADACADACADDDSYYGIAKSARSSHRKAQADKLLELLRESK